MYKNKAPDGRNNLCGKQIAHLRKQMRPRVSQRLLAERLQVSMEELTEGQSS